MRMRSIISTVGFLSLLAACGSDVVFSSNGTGGGGGGGGTTSSSSSSGTTSSGTTSSSSSSSGTTAQCDGPGQCVLVSETCCGVCGQVTLDDMVAMHEDEVEAYQEELCPEGTVCPACTVVLNPNLFAYCNAGQCRGADMASGSFGECTAPEDCKLRWGLDCCECGNDGAGLTAIPVAFETKLQQLVCEPDSACPECAPQYPPDAEAWCDAGHCVVMYFDYSSGS